MSGLPIGDQSWLPQLVLGQFVAAIVGPGPGIADIDGPGHAGLAGRDDQGPDRINVYRLSGRACKFVATTECDRLQHILSNCHDFGVKIKIDT